MTESTNMELKKENKSFFTKAFSIGAFVLLLYHFLYICDAFTYLGIKINPFLHVAVHIAFMISFVYLLVPAKKGTKRNVPPWYDIILAVLSIIPPLYHGLFYVGRMELIAGIATTDYVVLGWLYILLILEAARRTIGLAFTLILVVFLAYPLTASHLPGFLYGFSWSLPNLGVYLYQSPSGILGMPVRISSIVIIAFLFFGQLLAVSGAGTFFIELAQGIMGRFRGGPAKIAVLGSMFFGMISGSSVSNVMTSGVFTIPMMKKIGFKSNFAGAVEAVASNGGQFMPPIMGAAIFILVDFTGIPYVTVMFASFIPAFLFFLGVLLVVDLEAAKTGMKGLLVSELPSVKNTLKTGYIYVIPLIVLLYLLIVRSFAPQKAALWAIVVVLIVASLNKKTRLKFMDIVSASETTIRGMLTIATACASVGIVMGSLNLTGLGTILAGGLVEVTGGNIWLLLPITAVTCYIMGMGMGTLPIYIFLAMMVAPALVTAGVPVLAAHLFILWWGLTSFITPPVCLNCYAAASISGGNGLKTGLEAMRLAAATYIVPFAFVTGPALLLIGSTSEIILAIISAAIGIAALASGLQGWMFTKTCWIERVLLIIGSVVLIFPGLIMDAIGLGMVLAALLINLNAYRSANKMLSV